MIFLGCEKKRFLPNLGLYPEICLKGLRKTMRNVRTAGLHSEPEPSEYEAKLYADKMPEYSYN